MGTVQLRRSMIPPDAHGSIEDVAGSMLLEGLRVLKAGDVWIICRYMDIVGIHGDCILPNLKVLRNSQVGSLTPLGCVYEQSVCKLSPPVPVDPAYTDNTESWTISRSFD